MNTVTTFEMILTNSKKLSEIESIYLNSFPKEEQHPFKWLVKMAEHGKGHFAGLSCENRLVGMTYFTVTQDIVYIFYFAIDPSIRSKGCGQKMMLALQHQYAHHNFMLLIEEIIDGVENMEERIRRKKFYLQNGFESKNDTVEVLGSRFELLHLTKGNSSLKDYQQIKQYFYED
ncbi:hypothetical protein IGI39_002067 [Enterococcus sp. AZ135]|uniref:GNAT family N-acetyltransferase n=1 Tax=unclassified Enterococcus TaxID=2608891 RepID=UPI003F24C446